MKTAITIVLLILSLPLAAVAYLSHSELAHERRTFESIAPIITKDGDDITARVMSENVHWPTRLVYATYISSGIVAILALAILIDHIRIAPDTNESDQQKNASSLPESVT